MFTYNFQGASGKTYQYSHIPEVGFNNLSKQGGNYIIARGPFTTPEPLCISEANNIRASMESELWRTAKEIHGATMFFVHIEPGASQGKRQDQQMDLIANYTPKMNQVETTNTF